MGDATGGSESTATNLGTQRLQGAGVGSIVGGIILGLVSFGLSYPAAAGTVFVLGVLGWLFARRSSVPTTPSVGVAAIGGIALVEATPGVGIGISAFELAVVAVGFGLFDVLAGGTLGRYRRRFE